MKLNAVLINEAYKHKEGNRIEGLGSKSISLVGARNQKLAFQLLLEASEPMVVAASEHPVFTPVGPLPIVRVHLEGFEALGWKTSIFLEGMMEDDDKVQKADLLLHQETILVESGTVQALWIELDVPEAAPKMTAQGKIQLFAHRLFEDEKLADELDVRIDIKNVTLPRPTEHDFYLDLWQHLSNIARKHEVSLWSEEHFRVIENYVKSLADLGQKAITVIATEIPWSGQGCFETRDNLSDLFEYSMIAVEKDLEGKWHLDFTAMDRYIRMCFAHGIDQEIEVFGLSNIWTFPEEGYGKLAEDFPDACRIRYFDRSEGVYRYMRQGKEIEEYIIALEQHFIEKGWIDRVRVVADEPSDTELYRQRITLLKKLAPSFEFKTAINHAEFIREFKDQVRDYVPILTCVCQEWDVIRQLKQEMEGRIYWYVCCGPAFPNTFLRSPLVESCLIGWMTAYLNMDGFLRWNYTVWPQNPREKIAYRYPNWSAGDTNFVYPGNDGRPILTLRYKMLKRGIEDFELIRRIQKEHPQAEEVLQKAYGFIFKDRDVTDFHPSKGVDPEELYSMDYQDYVKARSLLLEELEALEERSF